MPTTTSKNLGQISAVIRSVTAPTNTDVMWLDISGPNSIKKIWDPNAQAWILWTAGATVAGDNWGTQVVEHDGTLAGDGTTGAPLSIGQQNAVTGQVLTWTGSTWGPQSPANSGLTAVTVDDTLKGNGTTGQPLGLAQNGAQDGQVLIWGAGVWAPGQPQFNGFVRGMIILWSGALNALPTGWTLCDGTSGAPNLSGRFVVGYDANDGDYNAIDGTKVGGLKQVSLTANQNGPHNHTVNDPGHVHSGNVYQDLNKSGGNNPDYALANLNQGQRGWQTPSAQTGITIGIAGSGDAHENRPPYYALAYIMKL